MSVQLKSTRRSFPLQEKRAAVRSVESLMELGHSRKYACSSAGISPRYFGRWAKAIKRVDALQEDGYVHHNITGSAKRIHKGRPGFLQPIQQDLYKYIIKLREQGVQTTNHMVIREASRLLPSFGVKSFHAKEQIVHRLTKQLGLTRRVATHTAQKHFKETEKEAKDFIAMVKARLHGRNREDIINMDQTPIQYSFHSRTTLDIIGKKTIQVRASTTDTKRVTLAASVTASGQMLTPYMIFKGAPNGRIATREFITYHAGGKYACQPKAWMDESKMHEWIDLVLKPYKDKKDERDPDGPPLVLVLDSYRVHLMGSVVNRIHEMGIEVFHIPGGCTYLCQPVDIGINKPLKAAMRAKWEVWMTDGDGIINGVAKEPSRKQVAEWLVDAYNNIPETVGQNAWLKTNYKWF